MNRAAVSIPEKLFFKIGEVCDIVGIQAHVLRYWESEFPMLAPQKNRAGQRTYRKRDVEMVLRIRELLYEEQYTIPGARKRLASDLRGASRLKVVTPEMSAQDVATPAFDHYAAPPDASSSPAPQMMQSPTASASLAISPASSPAASQPAMSHPDVKTSSDETGANADQSGAFIPVARVAHTAERRDMLNGLRAQLLDLLAMLDEGGR